MDEVLKELREMRGEMTGLRGDVNGLRAEMGELRGEVRRDIAELRVEMGELQGEVRRDIAELRGEVKQLSIRLDATEAHLVERIFDTETKLLKAFYPWGRTSDIKTRHTAERVTDLDLRVTEIERRSNLGQQ